jgi:hypothetical protein
MLNYNQKLMLRRAERRILEKKKIRERLNKSGWNGIDFLNDPNHYKNRDGQMKALLKKAKGLFKTTMSPDKKKPGKKSFSKSKHGYGHYSGLSVNFQPRIVLKEKAIRKAEMEENSFYHE